MAIVSQELKLDQTSIRTEKNTHIKLSMLILFMPRLFNILMIAVVVIELDQFLFDIELLLATWINRFHRQHLIC